MSNIPQHIQAAQSSRYITSLSRVVPMGDDAFLVYGPTGSDYAIVPGNKLANFFHEKWQADHLRHEELSAKEAARQTAQNITDQELDNILDDLDLGDI